MAGEALGGVRGDPADDALERQRARLRADDAQAGRLGEQRGVEAGVALERRERAEAAVLLGRRRPAGRPRARRRPERRIAASACRAATTAPFMSTAPRPCRRPSSTAPDHGPSRHGSVPGETTSTWPLSAIRAGPVAGQRSRSGPTARSRGASSPGWSGCARSAGEVVLGAGRRRARPRAPARASRSSAARSSPVTLGTCTSARGVARERIRVQSGERVLLHRAASLVRPSDPGLWSRARADPWPDDQAHGRSPRRGLARSSSASAHGRRSPASTSEVGAGAGPRAAGAGRRRQEPAAARAGRRARVRRGLVEVAGRASSWRDRRDARAADRGQLEPVHALAGSRWRGRSPASRPSCSSTSRPAGSTPRPRAAARALVTRHAARGGACVWATRRLDALHGIASGVTLLAAGRVRYAGSVEALALRALAGSAERLANSARTRRVEPLNIFPARPRQFLGASRVSLEDGA